MTQILFLDNDRDFLDTRGRSLQDAGFRVLPATSIPEARSILTDYWAPILLLDVRLEDDDDDKDQTGLTFSRDPLCLPSYRLMLTRDPDRVRNWLQAGSDGTRHPRIDVMDKADGPEVCIARLRQIAADEIDLNPVLALNWNHGALSALHIANLVTPDLSPPVMADRAGEVSDLFRRLFRHSQHLQLERLLWHDAGMAAVAATHLSGKRTTENLIILIGERELVFETAGAYGGGAASAIIRGATIPALQDKAQTSHLAACTLAGVPLDQAKPLEEFIRSKPKRADQRAVISSTTNTIAVWAHGQFLSSPGPEPHPDAPQAGTAPRNIPLEQLQANLELLPMVANRHRIQVDIAAESVLVDVGLGRTSFVRLLNPLSVLGNPDLAPSDIWHEAAPGRISPQNLFVDSHHKVWWSDIRGSDAHPPGWLLAELENIVRFQAVPEMDLASRYTLEERLSSTTVNLLDLSLSHRFVAEFISEIRQAATTSGIPLRDYHRAVLAQTLTCIARAELAGAITHAQVVLVIHALITASLVAQSLLKPARPKDPTPPGAETVTLRLDESQRAVFLGSRRLKLTDGQYKVFACLYGNRDAACDYKSLFEALQGKNTFTGSQDQIQLLHTTMSRLREKLVTNQPETAYLHSVRAYGWRLTTTPSSSK